MNERKIVAGYVDTSATGLVETIARVKIRQSIDKVMVIERVRWGATGQAMGTTSGYVLASLSKKTDKVAKTYTDSVDLMRTWTEDQEIVSRFSLSNVEQTGAGFQVVMFPVQSDVIEVPVYNDISLVAVPQTTSQVITIWVELTCRIEKTSQLKTLKAAQH